MAQKAYVGVNGISRNVKNIYVGVNGVARKVVKGYVGVNGIARQFWGAIPPSVGYWDYWTSVGDLSNPIMSIRVQNSDSDYYKFKLYKRNNKIAYYGTFYTISNNYFSYFLMSPDADAVVYDYTQGSQHRENTNDYITTVTDPYNGITWYIAGFYSFYTTYWMQPEDSNYFINDLIYSSASSASDKRRVLQSVANYTLQNIIYNIPFHENYQVGQYYDRIPACGDIRRTIRKIVGFQLAYNVDKYERTGQDEEGYKTYSDNIDDIIDEFVADVHQYGNDNGMVIVSVQDYFWSGSPPLDLYHGHYKDGTCESKINYLEDVTITNALNPNDYYDGVYQDGFPAKLLKFMWDYGYGEGPEEVNRFWDWEFMERSFCVYCNADGTYETHGEEAGWGGQFSTDAFLGMFANHYYITNLGIDL